MIMSKNRTISTCNQVIPTGLLTWLVPRMGIPLNFEACAMADMIDPFPFKPTGPASVQVSTRLSGNPQGTMGPQVVTQCLSCQGSDAIESSDEESCVETLGIELISHGMTSLCTLNPRGKYDELMTFAPINWPLSINHNNYP